MLGVMGVVLVGALISVGRSLFSGDNPPAARAAAASAERSGETRGAAGGALPASERYPFSSPRLQRAAATQAGMAQAPGPPSAGLRPAGPIFGPMMQHGAPVLVPPTAYVRVQPIPPLPMGRPATTKPPGTSPAEEMALARSIRVTAIVMGARPYAVLEPLGSTPRTLHSSERYHSLRLVAIRAGEIVLKGQSGLWTLPLATPENEAGADGGKN